MQPQETFTIKELSEIFKMSRQAISKHIQKLDSSMIAKNERGYKVVLRSGVLQLARNLDNQRLLDRLHEYEQDNDKNVHIPSKNMVANKLLDQLREENKFLREQLILKEQNNSQIQKLLDQQQQLTLQANQQIEKLQEQLQLTYTEESPENESTAFSEEKDLMNDIPPTKRPWWQIWKN
ncbi:helix-turn-helix domain-containing protein [Enterococcus faecalis]|nr:helix-turn-helix domain-containing protein [Enterococcus faecalis]EHG8752943.1 helix-turn-helix domain-containing protein [Enterococcus faecalis]EHZ9257568.1 helix-turn-helix domain-containing protein [Enterococcus faecalis]EKZ0236433.1 helix-turn-helix domain-containing protein [Enterococcus faecalis]